MDRFSKLKHQPKKRLSGNEQVGFGKSLIKTENLDASLLKVMESESDLEWALNKAISEGPPHKQLRNSIILNQLAEIIDKLKVGTKNDTIPLTGTNPKEFDFKYPVGIPKVVLKFIKENKLDESFDWMSEGPYHEVAVDTLVMHCLASISSTIEK